MTVDLARIREATDIRELIGGVVKLKNLPGHVASGLCPFHDEKTPSFRVNLPGHRFAGRFRCHGCGERGDVLDFVRKLEGISLQDAVRRLAADAGIPIDGRPETREEREQRLRDREERDMCAWYFREEWKLARRGLNRAMEQNPQIEYAPIGWTGGKRSGGELVSMNLAAELAEFYGARLRWIEANRATDAGLREFRAAKVPASQYRAHLARKDRLHKAQSDFADLVLSAPLSKV